MIWGCFGSNIHEYFLLSMDIFVIIIFFGFIMNQTIFQIKHIHWRRYLIITLDQTLIIFFHVLLRKRDDDKLSIELFWFVNELSDAADIVLSIRAVGCVQRTNVLIKHLDPNVITDHLPLTNTSHIYYLNLFYALDELYECRDQQTFENILCKET